MKSKKPSKKVATEKPAKKVPVQVETKKAKTGEKRSVLRKKVAAARKALVGIRKKYGRLCKTEKIEKLLGQNFSVKVVARALKVPSRRVQYVVSPQ
jgi:hypothetical protein